MSVCTSLLPPLKVSATAMVAAVAPSNVRSLVSGASSAIEPVNVTTMPTPTPEHAAAPVLNVTVADAMVDRATSAVCTCAAVASNASADVVAAPCVSLNEPSVPVHTTVWTAGRR